MSDIRVWTNHRICTLLTGLLSSAMIQAAWAEEPPQAQSAPSELEEVVVTAQKTSENIMRVPMAITAVTANELASQHIDNIQDLTASVPNFNFGTYAGTARIAIRGVGFDSINTGAEARVANYVDGVYYSRPATAAGSFFDVAQVEVLRGPQGTLYGRNATGGALNTTTADPTSALSGYYDQTFGNYGLFTEEGAISGPFTNTIDARLAFQINNRDGYGKNLLTGADVDNAKTQSVRAKIKDQVTDDFSLLASFDYHHENDRDFTGHYGGQAYPSLYPVDFTTLLPVALPGLGAPAPSNIRDVATQYGPYNHRDFYGAQLTGNYTFDEMALKSISAYRVSNYNDYFPLTPGAGGNLDITEDADQLSEELQLSKKAEQYHWIAGIFAFREVVHGQVNIPLGYEMLDASFGAPIAAPSPNGYDAGYWAGGTETTKTAAGYGQLSYDLTSKLEVTVGLREAWESKHVVDGNQFNFTQAYLQPNPLPGAITQNATSNYYSTTPKFSASYQFEPDLMAYFTVAKGYKSGGYDLGSASPAYSPETLWDYETGMKGEFFEHRLRFSSTVFYYDYSNLQVSVVDQTLVLTKNAAKSRSYGVEAEAEALLTDDLHLTASGGYLNDRFVNFVTADPGITGAPVKNYSGYTPDQAPEFQAKIGAQYFWHFNSGTLSARGDADYTSRIFFTPFDLSTASQGAYTKYNASVDFEAVGGWHVSVYGRNLANKLTVSSSTLSSYAVGQTPLVSYLDPPRTFGVTVGIKF
jgi:iron complex outermembrane receptor protein